jgi:hypothetical protein
VSPIGTINDMLSQLHDLQSRVGEQVALLSMLAIARIIRSALPQAAAVSLAWSDQGPHLVPGSSYLAADGTAIGEGSRSGDDALDAAIGPYCAALVESNEGTWGAFMRSTPDRRTLRLAIEDVLAAGEPDVITGQGAHSGSAPPPAAVWVLQHDDGHGEELSVHASYEHGLAALAQTVRGRWDNVADRPGVPATCADLSDAEAVEMYFRQRETIECYWLLEEDVKGIPETAPPADQPNSC